MKRIDREMRIHVFRFLMIMTICTIALVMLSPGIKAKAEEITAGTENGVSADTEGVGSGSAPLAGSDLNPSGSAGAEPAESGQPQSAESGGSISSDSATSNPWDGGDSKSDKDKDTKKEDDDKKEKHKLNYEPSVSLKRDAPTEAVQPGEEFTLRLTIANHGKADMKDVTVSVKSNDVVYVIDGEGSKRLSEIEDNKGATISYKMKAAQELKGDHVQVEVELKYFWNGGDVRESTTDTLYLTIPINMGTSPKQPLLTIERGEFLQGNVQPGQEFDMIVNLTNASKKDVYGLVAFFETSDAISLISQTEGQQIGDLKSGENAPMILRFKAAKDLKNASYPVSVKLKFNYAGGDGMTEATQEDKILIPTTPENKTADPTPYMIVENYTYGDKKIMAGDEFDLHLKFRNTSSLLACENVVISLEMGDAVTIASSSNTFYVPRIEPGGSTEEDITLAAAMELKDLKDRSPKVTVHFKYEFVDNEERKSTEASSAIAIPVYEEDRFSTSAATMTNPAYAGEEMTISVPYMNRGRGIVYNVEGSLKLDNVESSAKIFNAGNVEAGRNGTIDFIVTPTEAGNYNGIVAVTYENSAAEKKTIEVPVEFAVEEMALEEEPMMEEMEEEPQGPSLPVIFGGIAVCAAGVLGGIRWKRKKKKTESIQVQENDYWGDEKK